MMTTIKKTRIACHECDLVVSFQSLASGEKAYCPRCNYTLAANRPATQKKLLAFSVSALIFLLLANMFPFLGFIASGQEHTVTLWQSIMILITKNFASMAAIVFAATIAIPGLFLLGVVYVSISLTTQHLQPHTKKILRWVFVLLPWSMAEIFLIGILISFIKIVAIADVTLGLSFWAYVLFSLCTTIVMLNLDKWELWQHIRKLENP